MPTIQLELDNAEGTLEKFEPKADKEGRFAYLHLSFGKLKADVLDFFGPGTQDRMFKSEAVENDLFERDPEAGETLCVRDNGEIYPQKRAEEMSGARLKLSYGVGSAMEFASAFVDDFEITPQDGGWVIISCRAKVRPDEGQAGRLYMMNGGPITATLEPLEVSEALLKDAA